MTKRLFAIVLAAVLAITMFTFPAAAAAEIRKPDLTRDETVESRLNLDFVEGKSVDSCTEVVITLLLDGVRVGNPITLKSDSEMAKKHYEFDTSNKGGKYIAQVTYYAQGRIIETKTTDEVSIPVTTNGTNCKVIYDNATTIVFDAKKENSTYITRYYIAYTDKNGGNYGNAITPSIDTSTGKATYNFTECDYANLASLKIYVATESGGYTGNSIASWTNKNSGSSGIGTTTSNGLTVSGAVEATVQNGYIYITIKDNPYYSYRYGVITTTSTTPTYQYLGTSKTFYIPISNMYGGMYITVEGTNAYTTSQYGNWATIGGVTFMGYNTGYYPGYYPGTTYPWGGNTGLGSGNIRLSIANGYATATWNQVYGAMGYFVLCTPANGSSKSLYTEYNYMQLPFTTADSGWSIQVYAQFQNGQTQPVGTAYANSAFGDGSTGTGIDGVTKSLVKNLTVTPVSSTSTTLSWQRYAGAECYYISYSGRNGLGIGSNISYKTSISIPFGSGTAYQAYVYAMDSNGTRIGTVGYVYNVPGTTADSNEPASTGKDYPSNFTAKSKDKKISLSWKAAEDASYYNIYYKRATSSSWTKISQKITKTAVNISGLTNGIEYDFKVVPNKGSESGVATIAPSASSSKTVTARDPSSSDDGDVNLDDEELTITSVSSSSTGKIKVTWSNVGAPSYRIYVAEGTSSSYKACGTYTGTSATISTFGTGSKATSFKSGKTYKVRIIRTDYTGTIESALKACPYKTVTVK